MNHIKSIYLTGDPGQHFSRRILQFSSIKGIRCNTGAPVTSSKTIILKNFQADIYPISPWVDLKCRELRLVKEAIIPTEYLELNHKIDVKVPTALYYNEGKNILMIDKIIDETKLKVKPPDNFKGDELIRFGKGTSVNIPDPSLKVHGYLTQTDKEYINDAKEVGIHNYFLSFVESIEDLNSLYELDPKAVVFAKIESKKGLHFVKNQYKKVKDKVRLVAARADLYIELERPHEIIEALKLIIEKDPKAIAASRILESFLELYNLPRCSDFTDLAFLKEIGYESFLLGDDLCQKEDILLSVLGVLELI